MKPAAGKTRVFLFCSGGKWPGKILLAVALAGLGAGIFLSCRPSPAFQGIRWLPHWAVKWADRHGVMRNFPAYALLAAPFLLLTRNNVARRIAVMIFLLTLAVALEVIQLWIPSRVADGKDVLASWGGLLAAWGVFELGWFITRKMTAGTLNEQ